MTKGINAVVLAGGGALGAYEAGVLRYILKHIPTRPDTPHFRHFAGTSVGGFNACFLAALADHPRAASRVLCNYWKSLTFDRLVGFGSRELQGVFRLLLGRFPQKSVLMTPQRPPAGNHPPVAGIFDTTPLFDEMRKQIPWHRIKKNLDSDLIGGVALCATEICTSKSVVFYQTSPTTTYRAGRDPCKESRPANINVEHAMASAAMPFLFPGVQIDGVCYTDGGLRQNTPLNPALRLGADRLLVISVTQEPAIASRIARIGCRKNPYPGLFFLLGRTMQAVLSQSLDYEIDRVELYNRLISGGCEIYGESFIDNLNQLMGKVRNANYRRIDVCHIRPSMDVNQLAREAILEAPDELTLRGPIGNLFSKLLRSSAFLESDLLSVIGFTPKYIRSLLELGYRDAERSKDRLQQFFSGEEPL